MSRRIVILTNPGDPHSFAVQHVLRRKGVEPVVWHTSDFPTRQSGSLLINQGSPSWNIVGSEIEIYNASAFSIWIRRPDPPVLPEDLEPEDRRFTSGECSTFLRSLHRLIGKSAFWVNPIESYGRASLKTEQLLIASQMGFKVPTTLCSNDPARIRDFVRERDGGAIYKSFLPGSWKSESGVSALFTTRLSEEELDDEALAVCPGIFQEYVPKAYELRVTMIGRQLFTVKILSQEVDDATIDWRAALGQVPLEPWVLPSEIEERCLKVMDDLGLVFGCFDLIVTPDGEYVFLELNEMGAFLWIEQALPEMPLLDCFCELLIQGRVDFQADSARQRVCWDEVSAAVRQQMEQAPRDHVLAPR